MTTKRETVGTVPILIVGGGPVGLALAAELGWRAVPCMLVERKDGSINHPKMNQITSRTMEICRRWGVAEEVRRLSIPEDFPRTFLYSTGIANGYELARVEFPARKDVVLVHSPEALQRCSQLYFDPMLREHARSYPQVNLNYLTEFVGFEELSDGVLCLLQDVTSKQKWAVKAQYLVACDGADSMIRQRMGISLIGDDALSFNTNIFFRSRAHDRLFAKGRAIMHWILREDGLWGDVVSINGDDLWRCSVMRLPVGTKITNEQAKDYLRLAVGADFDFEIVSVLPWLRKRVVAEPFSKGRVFLAGDAAHQMSPTGGFGMNTGIAEAVDIGWKLAAMVQGWGGSHLLASYDSERRPIAMQMTDEGARNYIQFLRLPSGPDLLDPGERGHAFREEWTRVFRDLRMDREYDSEGLVLGYRYEGSPIIWPDGSPEPQLNVMHYEPTSRPGHRAPHVFLSDGRSIFDLFGAGFSLVVFDQDQDVRSLVEAAEERNVPLRIVSISEAAVAELYEHRLVLVRPDGHVAWRGNSIPANPAELIDRIRGG